MDAPRTNTQKLLTLHVDPTLFEAIEQSRGRINRSQWIRDAIAEKSAREGIVLPDKAVYAPDRARAPGGRKWAPRPPDKKADHQPFPDSHMLNEEPPPYPNPAHEKKAPSDQQPPN